MRKRILNVGEEPVFGYKTLKGEERMTDWIKKAMALALCLVMVLSLAACGSGEEPVAESAAPSAGAAGSILTDDEDIYMAAMGDFYDAYMAASTPRR